MKLRILILRAFRIFIRLQTAKYLRNHKITYETIKFSGNRYLGTFTYKMSLAMLVQFTSFFFWQHFLAGYF